MTSGTAPRACRTNIVAVLKRIAVSLALTMGCASSDPSDGGRDVPVASEKETRGADLPVPAPVENKPLVDWSFEPASADCNGWTVAGAEGIRASPAHSGSYSCKMCSNGSEAGVGLTKELGAVPAGRYVLSAWVGGRPQNPAPNEAVARIEVDSPEGPRTITTPPTTVRTAWDHLEAVIDLDRDVTQFTFTIGSASAAVDHCLFVDDVSLTRQ